MKIIIAGGREFDDYQKLKEFLLPILKVKKLSRDDIEIVSGTARGADRLGERFAEEFNLKCTRMPADWNTHGRAAGYIRNEEMAVFAKDDGMLIACWDGKSKGTGHMINLARKHELEIEILSYD